MATNYSLIDYLNSLLRGSTNIAFYQDFKVIEQYSETRTSKLLVACIYPYLSECLENSDLLIIDQSIKSEMENFDGKKNDSNEGVFHDAIDSIHSDSHSLDNKDVDTLLDNNKAKSSVKSHLCQFCPKLFTDPRKLKVHVYQRHTKSLKCKQCNKMFSNQSELNKHSVKHSNNYFKCTFCDVKIKHKRNFKRHMEIHSSFIAEKVP